MGGVFLFPVEPSPAAAPPSVLVDEVAEGRRADRLPPGPGDATVLAPLDVESLPM